MSNKTHSTVSLDAFMNKHNGLGRKDSDLTFFKPTFDIEEFKKRNELEGFRRTRRNFFRFIFTILGIHSAITLLLLGTIPLAAMGILDVDLNILIPSYFINIAVQVFALMRAVVKYFDKDDFIVKG